LISSMVDNLPQNFGRRIGSRAKIVDVFIEERLPAKLTPDIVVDKERLQFTLKSCS
jgi:hypothetical protein